MLLSGILSLPWSPLASLPPEVEVPLPLLVSGVIPDVSLFEEEGGAGSGCHLGTWALAITLDNTSVPASAIVMNLMLVLP
jgi:hypothetical protein